AQLDSLLGQALPEVLAQGRVELLGLCDLLLGQEALNDAKLGSVRQGKVRKPRNYDAITGDGLVVLLFVLQVAAVPVMAVLGEAAIGPIFDQVKRIAAEGVRVVVAPRSVV